jgi:hypothetical protein
MSVIFLTEQANGTNRASYFLSYQWELAWSSTGSRAEVVNLIANTQTEKVVAIEAEIDEAFYLTGFKITVADMGELAVIRDEFHCEWNDMIGPTVDQ